MLLLILQVSRVTHLNINLAATPGQTRISGCDFLFEILKSPMKSEKVSRSVENLLKYQRLAKFLVQSQFSYLEKYLLEHQRD